VVAAECLLARWQVEDSTVACDADVYNTFLIFRQYSFPLGSLLIGRNSSELSLLHLELMTPVGLDCIVAHGVEVYMTVTLGANRVQGEQKGKEARN
jgi:hypothetical protein